MKSNKPLTLLETQDLFWKIISHPEGVEDFLSKNPNIDLPIKDGGQLLAKDRLEIYANAYFFRIRDSLMDDFPSLVKLLGEDEFHNLVVRYLAQYPPQSYTLSMVGKNLPHFLANQEDLLQRYPYLADLAEMEWLMIDIYDKQDGELLLKEDLQKIQPEEWTSLKLKRIEAAKLLKSSWPLIEIYKGLQQEKPRLDTIQKTPTHVIVWRKKNDVFYKSVETQEYECLERLASLTTFESLCMHLALIVSEEEAIKKMVVFLQSWLQDELLENTFNEIKDPSA